MSDAGEARPAPRAAKLARHATAIGLTALVLAHSFFAAHYVPRLTNNMWSDAEFSGWGAAIARRVVEGALPYRDLVMPVPPGSLWILAAIQRSVGHARILDEAAVCAICHGTMAVLAYAIVRPFASRKVSLFVAAGSLATIIQLPKELSYDHTAQVFAWASLALLARVLARPDAARARVWLFAAAWTAGFVALFKQSTATGAVAAALLAPSLLGFLDARARGARAAAPRAIASLAVAATGAALGFASVLGAIAAAGGSPAGFLRVVYGDGAELKGGAATIVPRLLGYTTVDGTIEAPLLLAALAVVAVWRTLAAGRAFAAPSPADSTDREPSRRALAAYVLVLVGTATLGVLQLRLFVGSPMSAFYVASRIAHKLPPVGLALAAAYAVAALRARASGPRDAGFAVLLACAVAGAMFHNASVPEVRFFYDNNALVAVALLALFHALEHPTTRRLGWLAFVVLATSMLGGKMGRWLEARRPVGREGFWSGMYVSDAGAEIVRAARRVRELAGPDDEVLVLPEDVTFAALVGRPRPKLCGAVLFVDQYPSRCIADDLATFEAHPPKVVVVYPGHEDEWQRMYRIWSTSSPAGVFNHAILHFQLPAHYTLDSTYSSAFWNHPTVLDVYVRNDAGAEPSAEPRE